MLFNDVIGQQKTKELLLRSVHEGRVPHAQLFLGFEGSANLALALAFAQYVVVLKREKFCNGMRILFKASKKVILIYILYSPVATTTSIKAACKQNFLINGGRFWKIIYLFLLIG